MREHHGQAGNAAVLLHERLEQLTSQLSELESLRARVLEAEWRLRSRAISATAARRTEAGDFVRGPKS